MLKIADFSLSLDSKQLYRIPELTINNGQICVITGDSGVGKSSFIHWLCGFISNDFKVSGTAILNEVDILSLQPQERKIGVLFQDAMLFPHMNVWENLAFAIPKQKNKQERDAIIIKALDQINLLEFSNKKPQTLSGGQTSRVSLMRVLLSEPKLLLLDEPFTGLDIKQKENCKQLILEIVQNFKLPAIVTAHDNYFEGSNIFYHELLRDDSKK